ncbi:hypothetical protein, partial [Escherichia coli]|uniref:hypothetical protein n=1 Tax=Escherichia coli TaxID=562 RepID=UPI001F1B3101
VTLKMPAFEWVHVQLHQQKGMISLSPPTICNSATISSVSILDCAIQNRRKNNDGFLYMIGFAGHCHFQKTTAPDNAV